MFDARRNAFLSRMAFGEQQTGDERPPRLKDLLIDMAWMLGATAYMVAVILVAVAILGH
jgi:hypothetical protein